MTPSTNPARDEAVAPDVLAKQVADAASDMCEIARIVGEWRHGPKQSLTAVREIRACLAAKPPASGVDAVKAALDADSGIAAFERWAQPAGYLMHLYEGPNSERRYLYASTDNAWLAWCASRSALSPAATSGSEAGGEPVGWAAVYDGDPKMFRRSRDELVANAEAYQAIHPVYFGPAWRHQED